MAFENNQDLYTLGISLLINVIFGVFILYSHRERKRIYKMLKDVKYSIKEKNEAIMTQSAKLAEAYEKLWKINQSRRMFALIRTSLGISAADCVNTFILIRINYAALWQAYRGFCCLRREKR